MKHNTHIYLAAKAIQLTQQSVDNTVDEKGKYLIRGKKTKERIAAKQRQRILQYYQDLIEEASWTPDDVLKDNNPFHIFKLFTTEEFPGHKLQNKPKFKKEGVTYYKFSGGLPYRIDHIAQEIITMEKLRKYNDQYDLKQIMYKYLLMSHYIADAHVPMHCDLRDDPPKQSSANDPSRSTGSGKPRGKYMKGTAHGDLETIWDNAVTPVAIKEEIIQRNRINQNVEKTEYSERVTFGLKDARKGKDIQVKLIKKNRLMDFMVDVCIESKKRGQKLFPVNNPRKRDDSILPQITHEIFSNCIGNLIAVWRYIWMYNMA